MLLFFRFKQKYPNVFNDLCLYSDVSILMTKFAFRLASRRFIQELFMDLQYEELYEEPFRILQLDPASQGLTSSSGVNAEGQGQLGQLKETPSEENIFQ